ncbi:carbohydrate-binding family 9-like protein [Tamlana sp. 2201CG12-4]|uniref:carbohydrate-binding family 9-like protein n=1 Tax=Tamlana sp. 2201CG12-4 TaxID=3112582 RepID=UPI002DB5AA08|nr:carbohydrate-binding family 9-like protein [Tamlana sp. 2201CG12-4]MEC3905451.1 carbohydrate-binding family 9-like protein [Tamlana sp. 2201CG12-4]
MQLNWAQDYKLSLEDRPVYKAKKTKKKIIIDGKMSERVWEKTEARTLDFHYKTIKPTDKQNTTFRMLWDDETLYLFYESEDKYLTSSEKNRDGMPFLDDCAEFFVIPVPNSASMHFCFEINLYEAKNDVVFINNFHKGNNTVVKAFNPDYQVKVITNGTINDNSDIDQGWTMELAIPIEAFRGSTELYPLKKGTKWAFLALRQERNDLEIGRRVTSTIFPIYDISKDAHQPNMFGLVEFIN